MTVSARNQTQKRKKGGQIKVNSLLNFFAFTKGVEYLIAIAFIIAFSTLWLIVYGKGKGLGLKIGLMSYLILGFILMLGSCLATRPH